MSITNNIKASFYNRGQLASPDYVGLVNGLINQGVEVDPDSQLYQSALEQYNNQEAKNGSMRRLGVPAGFCGYMDPRTNKFRVAPDNDSTILLPGRSSVNVAVTDSIELIEPLPYPIDECLKNGLPGSKEYANCLGKDDPYAKPSGIIWPVATVGANNSEYGGEGEEGGGPGAGTISGTPPSYRQALKFSASTNGSTVSFSYNPIDIKSWTVGGPDGGRDIAEAHMYRKINGGWVGGKFEWVPAGGKSVISLGNIKAGYNGHGTPTKGEQVAFMWVCYWGSPTPMQSNLAITTWN